ncbi:hypothetical protein BDAP_001629 [Binucleata daphniae]
MENLASYIYKNRQIYKKFLDAYFKIKENEDVEKNLEIMYSCLTLEQGNSGLSDCLEYLVNNNVLQSLLHVIETCEEYKIFAIKFIENCVHILPVDAITATDTVRTLNKLFGLKHPLVLPLSHVMCIKMLKHREIMFFYVSNNSSLIDFLFEFCFSGKEQDEYARTGLSHIFTTECKQIADYFILKNYFDQYAENFDRFFAKTVSCNEIVLYQILQKHFAFLEIMLKKCKILGISDAFLSKVSFDFSETNKLQLDYLSEIIVSTKNDNILAKLLNSIIKTECNKNHEKNSSKDFIIFLKKILEHRQLKINQVMPKDYIYNNNGKIIETMNKLAYENVYIDFENIKKLCKTNRPIILQFDLFSYLINEQMFDFDIFYLLLLQNKMLFALHFAKLKKMLLANNLSEILLLELWFCFSVI